MELKKLRFKENSGLDAHWRNAQALRKWRLRLLHPLMPFLAPKSSGSASARRKSVPFRSRSRPIRQYRQSATGSRRGAEVADTCKEIISSSRARPAGRYEARSQRMPVSGRIHARGLAPQGGGAIPGQRSRQVARVELDVIAGPAWRPHSTTARSGPDARVRPGARSSPSADRRASQAAGEGAGAARQGDRQFEAAAQPTRAFTAKAPGQGDRIASARS